MEVTVGGTGGQRRSGRGQGGRGTRSGMSGDSNGAGSLSSEAVGDVVGMEISIPESTLVEDGIISIVSQISIASGEFLPVRSPFGVEMIMLWG